jgi:hypothetical protein
MYTEEYQPQGYIKAKRAQMMDVERKKGIAVDPVPQRSITIFSMLRIFSYFLLLIYGSGRAINYRS